MRSLVIEKGPQGYGFNLSRLGTVHFLRLIEPGGAAERAGAQVRACLPVFPARDSATCPLMPGVDQDRQAADGERLRKEGRAAESKQASTNVL